MTDEEDRALAALQGRAYVPVMTEDEVFAALREHDLPPSALPYTRAEPVAGQPHPGDRVFRFPVELPDGRYLAVAWSFGQPSDDEVENWKIRWHAVEGPMDRAQLEAVARG
jgi:hypothetical protein